VVSEIPPGRGVYRWSFPARNRIMASLAAMTVVVEAAEPSGSLITAQFAEGLHREVGAVPGLVTSRRAMGTNRLLRDGASVIRGVDDVLDALFGARDWGAARTPDAVNALTHLERSVLDGVEVGEGAGAIGRRLGLSAGAVRAALGRLETLGLVARAGFGAYVRRAMG
jgi:DNA processing protein